MWFVAIALLLAQGLYEQALEALKAGRTEDAVRLLRAAPEEARTAGLLGVALDTLKRYREAEPYLKRAVELTPGAASLWNNLGNHYVATGDRAAAASAFRRVLAIEPGHANANLQMAHLAASGKRGAEVLAHLARLPGAEAATPEALLLRARALYWTGRPGEAGRILAGLAAEHAYAAGLAYAEGKQYKEAEAIFVRLLERDPQNEDLLYNLGLAALRAGDPARAAAVLARAQRRPDALLLLARALDQLGFYGDAARVYTSYIELRPADDEARRERGFASARSGDHAGAVADLEWYVGRHPAEPLGQIQLAIAQFRDAPEIALQRLDSVLKARPGDADARHARGVFLALRGEPQQAIADLDAAARSRPADARIQDALGKVYLQMERPMKALEALQRAEKLAPDDPRILMHLSQALRAAGRSEEARAVLARFRQASVRPRPHTGLLDYLVLPPSEQRARRLENAGLLIRRQQYEQALGATAGTADPELLLMRAITLELLKRNQEALTALAEIERRWPDWDRAYLVHAIILEIHNQSAAAREMGETAIALGSRSAEAYFYLALSISRSDPGNFAPAKAAVAESLRLNPNDPYARALAGKLALASEEYREAIDHLREAIRLFPKMVQAHYTLANVYRALGRDEEALAEMKAVRRIREESPSPELEMPPGGEILYSVRPTSP